MEDAVPNKTLAAISADFGAVLMIYLFSASQDRTDMDDENHSINLIRV